MDSSKIEQLKAVKERFRALKPKDREQLSIALLKVNLGVHSGDEMLFVQTFLDGLPILLEAGKLDPFLNFLHATSNITPQEHSGWFSREEIAKEISLTDKDLVLPPYDADAVDTIREDVQPFGKSRG